MTCRYCHLPVTRPRRTFCSDRCVHEWRMRSNRSYAREKVWSRDKGICAICGVDASNKITMRQKAESLGLSLPFWRRSFWDVHHQIAVADGGGDCGLKDLVTLCVFCHHTTTAIQQEPDPDRFEDFSDLESE